MRQAVLKKSFRYCFLRLFLSVVKAQLNYLIRTQDVPERHWVALTLWYNVYPLRKRIQNKVHLVQRTNISRQSYATSWRYQQWHGIELPDNPLVKLGLDKEVNECVVNTELNHHWTKAKQRQCLFAFKTFSSFVNIFSRRKKSKKNKSVIKSRTKNKRTHNVSVWLPHWKIRRKKWHSKWLMITPSIT